MWARLTRLMGRKACGYLMLMVICGFDAWRHGISWPSAAVMAMGYLTFVLGISGEKILGTIGHWKGGREEDDRP